MTPKISYTIWFSQRNGSSLLCEGLKSTGIAGKPGELFHLPADTALLNFYKAKDYKELQQKIWQKGMTNNGVFGLKVDAPRKENDPIIQQLARIPGINNSHPTNYEVWNHAFPHGKHIFLTRRNKVRQAVSWWKAIVTEEWHLTKAEERSPSTDDIRNRYNFEAIKHLLLEISFRETKTQAFFEEGNVIPFTIVYEDLILEYEKTIRSMIAFLGISEKVYPINAPFYVQLADEISDEWVERFRIEMQKDWKNIIW